MGSSLMLISILLILDQARAIHRATSPAIPGRRIGRADGLDLAFPGHFAKKSSNLGHFAKKTLIFCKKVLELRTFCKKTRSFCKKVLELRTFCKKALDILQKSPRTQAILQKSPRTSLEYQILRFPVISKKSPRTQDILQKKSPNFLGIQPAVFSLSQEFSSKYPRILLKLCNNLFHSLFLHQRHYTYNSTTKTHSNQNVSNIKFA